jgi:soluble lytic murein transglycosylase-like protein
MNNKVVKNPSIELSKLGDSDLSSPTPLKMYELIDHYSNIYEIPKHIAFNVAYLETRYKGPFDWKYKPEQTSYAGAVGPMQVMVSTARWINKDNISKERLKTDIKYNVYTSMKLLRILYNKRKNWKLVFGEYNTGRPCVNGYAERVFNHKIAWR